jgi:hypothetical protein
LQGSALCRPGWEVSTAARGDPAEIRRLCAAAHEASLLRSIALGAAALGTLLMVIIFGARSFAGSDRDRMSRVFGPAVQAVVLLSLPPKNVLHS